MTKLALFFAFLLLLNGLGSADLYADQRIEDPSAWASSEERSTLSAGNAIDGDFSTRWASAWEDNQWIIVDYKLPIKFSSVVLDWEREYAMYAISYRILVSNDCINWSEVYSTNTGDGDVDEIYVGEQIAKYLKIECIHGARPESGFSLYEIRIESTSAWASSQERPTLSAGNAIDGDFSTRWSSAWDDNQWIIVDYKLPIKFSSVVLNWDREYAMYAISYRILVSNDCINWSEVYSTNTGDGDVDEIYVGEQIAKYLKIDCIHGARPESGFSLYEIELIN